MKYLSFTLVSLISVSCAHGDKYEKSLPYKEGDTIEVKVSEDEFFDAFSRKKFSKSQVVNRFGYHGRNVLEVEKISFPNYAALIPKDIAEYRGFFLGSELFGEGAVMKVKVTSVARNCETETVMGRTACKNQYSDSYVDYLDKGLFLSWGSDFNKRMNDYVDLKKSEFKKYALEEEKLNQDLDPDFRRKRYPEEAAKCDKAFVNFRGIQSQIAGKSITETETRALRKKHKTIFEKVDACTGSRLYTESQLEELIK